MKVLRVVYYEKDKRYPLLEYMEDLRRRAAHNKKAQTHLNQLEWFIQKAQEDGLAYFDRSARHMINMPHVRKIRLGTLRLFFTVPNQDTMVLFHCFEKHTQKTPEKEKYLARREYEDFLARKASFLQSEQSSEKIGS